MPRLTDVMLEEGAEALKALKVPENSLFSIAFPFDKFLICPACHGDFLAKDVRYQFNRDGRFDYSGKCPKNPDGETVTFEAQDRYLAQTVKGLGLIRWPHLSIQVAVNPMVPGAVDYYWRPPRSIRALVTSGDKLLTSTLPVDMLAAIKMSKRVKLQNHNLFTLQQLELFANALLLKVREDSNLTTSQRFVQTLLAVGDTWWWAHLDPEDEDPEKPEVTPP